MQALFYIAVIFVLLTVSSCEKIYHCEGKTKLNFRFKLPVTISPAKDTFFIGDTIWIENSFASQLLNQKNSKTYNIEKADFKTTFSIVDLKTPRPAASYSNPNIITQKGETVGSAVTELHHSMHIKYSSEGGKLIYRAAFIPDKSGLFLFQFFSLSKGKTDITECNNEGWELEYITNGGNDNNYEMLKHSADTDFVQLSKEDFDKMAAHGFYVK